jgi:two-component system, chemotaxis family, protein-glutamate methylesterase/glutaminase
MPCHGALWQVGGALPPRYRCHTGHGFSQRSLEQTLASARDEAIWNAFRAVQENAFLLKGMAEQRSQDDAAEAARMRAAAQVLTDQACMLQKLLHRAPATGSG